MPLSNKQLGNLFTQGPNILIYPSGNSFVISASSSSSSGTIISGTNVGTGTGVFCGLTTTNNTNDTLAFYNLSGGNEVGISINDDNEIVIVRGKNVLNTLSNQGGGAKIFSAITVNTLLARTISGSAGLTSALAGTGNVLTRLAPTNTTANRFYIEDSTGVLTTNADFPIDATNGNISIDVAVSTTSRLLLASGTSSISQLRLTPFSTEPSSPINGDTWFTASGNRLKFIKDTTNTDFIFKDNNNTLTGLSNSILLVDTAGTLSTKYINSFGLFNALSSVTIANTASETSIISSVLTGSTTLLASTNAYNPELGVGRKFRFNAKGTIDTGDFVNLIIRLKLGSTVISSSSTITIGGAYFSEIEIDTTFTIRNSILVIGSGKILFLTGPPSTIDGDPIIFGIYSQDTTISTTTDQIFDCTAQFDIADPSNIITINESTLEILN